MWKINSLVIKRVLVPCLAALEHSSKPLVFNLLHLLSIYFHFLKLAKVAHATLFGLFLNECLSVFGKEEDASGELVGTAVDEHITVALDTVPANMLLNTLEPARWCCEATWNGFVVVDKVGLEELANHVLGPGSPIGTKTLIVV